MDHSILYALVGEKMLYHLPMHTRSSGPYVSLLTANSIPNCYSREISATNTEADTTNDIVYEVDLNKDWL